MNDRIEDLLNGLSGHSPLFDSFMKLSASDLVFVLAVVPPLLWLWRAEASNRAANQRIAATAVLAACVGLVAARLAGLAHWETRPFLSDGDTRLLIPHSADNGFPSEHATLAFAIAGAFLPARHRLGLLTLAGAFVLSIARVFVGVHWPDEVLAGMAIGLGAGLACAFTEAWFVEPQRLLARYLPSILISKP